MGSWVFKITTTRIKNMKEQETLPIDPNAPLAVACSDLLGEARVEAIKGYMENRLSLVGALEKKTSFYESHGRDREWIVEELKRIDDAVASLLTYPNAKVSGGARKAHADTDAANSRPLH